MARLVRPSAKYKRSYLQALKEFQVHSANWDPALDVPEKDFKVFIKKLNDWGKGINLPSGWIPASTFWLVEGTKYIGRISLRHVLTPKLKKMGGHIGYAVRPSERQKGYGTVLLRYALREAGKLGIKKALVTCYYKNLPSKTIIEHGGGVRAGSSIVDGKKHLKYWITVS